MTEKIPFRAGHIAVVGRPNVGKSTLINALVGYKVSIVSDRPQTTRHRIIGIHTEDAGQIVFVDTPGLHGDQKRAINRYMNRAARGALAEVQLAALVIEAAQWRDEDEAAFNALLEEPELPRVLIINKVDKITDKGELLPFIAKVSQGRGFKEIFPICARRLAGMGTLRRSLIKLLPESEPLYGEDEVTDRSERFLAAELVREQVMRQLGAEVPYATTVTIDTFTDEGKLLRIAATVHVERDGQKAIVIGTGGERMRSIGQGARLSMEKQFGRKVFLQLWCKVREAWSDDEAALRGFGYSE